MMSGAGGRDSATGQDRIHRNVTQLARPRLSESAGTGTPSQGLSESKSYFQSTRAATTWLSPKRQND